MPSRIDRTGEVNCNTAGKSMKILTYINSHDMTVLFLDSGSIKEHVYYGDFVRGWVTDPADALTKENLVGRKKMMNCGAEAVITDAYRDGASGWRVAVCFEDGTERNVLWDAFRDGHISNRRSDFSPDSAVIEPGMQRVSKSGEKYTVVSIESDGRVVIAFENGMQKSYSIASVRKNLVGSKKKKPVFQPEPLGDYCGDYAVGKKIVSACGVTYTITACYDRGQRVDALGDNGEEIFYKAPNSIKKRKSREVRKVSDVIGEKSYSSTHRECEIVGGDKLTNLDVRLSDGRVLHGIKYHKFKKGQITEVSNWQTRSDNLRFKYLGMRRRQNCGLEAEIVEYRSCNSITVKFSDGNTVRTTVKRFCRGDVGVHSQHRHLSLNELCLRWMLEPAGFKSYPCGTLTHLKGFGNKELDMFNEKLKIAVEYDGFYHKDHVDRDIEKDKLCQENGILLFRIRESKCPLLNDGISFEYSLSDSRPFSSELQSAVVWITSEIEKLTSVELRTNPFPEKPEDRDKIRRMFAKTAPKTKYIGLEVVNYQGEKGTVFEYLDTQHVGIVFDNGYITYRPLSAFKKGQIKCLHNHHGEINTSRCGELMEVVSNRYDDNRVDVQFEDGTLIPNCRYSDFLKGAIHNPNYSFNRDQAHIGETVQTRGGYGEAQIISVRRESPKRLLVRARLENGAISKETWYPHFKQGYIKPEVA